MGSLSNIYATLYKSPPYCPKVYPLGEVGAESLGILFV